MDVMEYQGYRGSVRYSADDRVLHGRILGIDDVVNFEGDTVDALERAFHEAVDDYLTLCTKLGRAPDRSYSGRIPLRIDAELHRRIAIAADSNDKSLNAWIADALEFATSGIEGRVIDLTGKLRESLESKGLGSRRRGPQRAAAKKKAKRKARLG